MVDGSHKKKQTKSDELPFTLITSEILSRLPDKSDIARCRCVCKQWKSYLSTPIFNQMHLQSHVSINDYKLLVFDGPSPISFRKFPLNITVPKPNPNPNPAVSIIASLNGLVCLASTDVSTLVFWNPLTGAYKKLASFPNRYTNPRACATDPVGFYTDSSNDYKLVFLVGSGRVGAYVYSLRLDSWRKIDISSVVRCNKHCICYNRHCFWAGGTFFDGCVYFTLMCVLNWAMVMTSHSWVVCFDVETETFRKIEFPPIPDGLFRDHKWYGMLVVLNGSIHLCVSYRVSSDDDIFIAKKHGELWRLDDGDKWVKVSSEPGMRVRRVCTASNGDRLALLDMDDDLFKEMNTEDFIKEYPYFYSENRFAPGVLYVESLVSP